MYEAKDGSLSTDPANEPRFIHLMLWLPGMYQLYNILVTFQAQPG